MSVGSGVRSGLRGLTLRGRAFLAAGLAAGLVGVLLGQRDLLRVGILLAALPLVSAWVVVRTRYRLACTRRLDPPRVAAGETATVSLRLDNVSRLPSGVLLMEDALPYVLGGRPRFVLDRIEPQGVREVTYPVRSEVRGRYVVDKQGDVIEDRELEDAVLAYGLSSRAAKAMHAGGRVAEGLAFPLTTMVQRALGVDLGKGGALGLWRIHDDAAWRAIRDGRLRSLSLGGTAVREEYAGDHR